MRRNCRRAALLVALAFGLSGCGAAYYGAVALIVLLSKKSTNVQTTFPDSVPTAETVPAFATLKLSDTQITVQRKPQQGQVAQVNTQTTTGNNNLPATNNLGSSSTVDVTGFEILGVEFPPGFGESRSNRDTATTLAAGDKLVIRVNEDASKEIAFDAADAAIATVGSAVAARIQLKVRALAPTATDVPKEAYTLFTTTFDESTRSYLCRSGVPGEKSEVVFQPAPRTGKGDIDPSDDTKKTAARLGFGVGAGAIETHGADSIGVVVLNRGDDEVKSGTKIDLYLAHNKVLNKSEAILFDRMTIDHAIVPGEARRFTRRNGAAPPDKLLRQDITPGLYYVIFDVGSSNSEKILDNNTLTSGHPIEVYMPAVDPSLPATQAVKLNALDFAIASTSSPISMVTGNNFTAVATVTNLGAAVPAPGVVIDIDVVFSLDTIFNQPGVLEDPARTVAGVRVNPVDPNRRITVDIKTTGSGPIDATVSGDTVTVTYNAAVIAGDGVAMVQSLTDILAAKAGTVVDAGVDGRGNPVTDSLNALLAAAKTTKVVTGDILVASKQFTFGAVERQNQSQSFVLADTLHLKSFNPTLLPLKVFPLFRVRPRVTGDPENAVNNARQGASFVRVYDRARATFDTVTGATLPTINSDDFAALEAVTIRPVTTGSIRQGQQRVFKIELPEKQIPFAQSQLLVILRTNSFDPYIDLLSSTGEYLLGADDSALGVAPIIYVPAQAVAQNRALYLVVSSARFDESDLTGGNVTFELTVSVNPKEVADAVLVNAVSVDNFPRAVKQRYDPEKKDQVRTENDVLVPFSMATTKAEIMFVLPQRARVRLRSKPVFTVGVQATITEFLEGKVPTPVEFQAELDEAFNRIVYRPLGGDINTSHVFEPGVYTVALEALGSTPDTQPLRLEIDTAFVPPPTITQSGSAP